MDSAKILHSVLNVILILLVVSVSLSIVLGILYLSGIDMLLIESNTNGSNFKDDPIFYILAIILLLVYSTFAYGIWQLRKVAYAFLKTTFFSLAVVDNLAKAGKSFTLTGMFGWVIDGISRYHFDNALSLSMSDKTFIYLFITGIGLFLLFMSVAMKNAVAYKSENDLTI